MIKTKIWIQKLNKKFTPIPPSSTQHHRCQSASNISIFINLFSNSEKLVSMFIIYYSVAPHVLVNRLWLYELLPHPTVTGQLKSRPPLDPDSSLSWFIRLYIERMEGKGEKVEKEKEKGWERKGKEKRKDTGRKGTKKWKRNPLGFCKQKNRRQKTWKNKNKSFYLDNNI